MKLKKLFGLHEKLKEKLGDDLVYSLAYDHGKYILAVSSHKSEDKKFVHGKPIQSCYFSEVDLNEDIDKLTETLTVMYKEVLTDKNNEVSKDVIE